MFLLALAVNAAAESDQEMVLDWSIAFNRLHDSPQEALPLFSLEMRARILAESENLEDLWHLANFYSKLSMMAESNQIPLRKNFAEDFGASIAKAGPEKFIQKVEYPPDMDASETSDAIVKSLEWIWENGQWRLSLINRN